MRINKTKEIIPEKIVERNTYQCENCNTEHLYESQIYKCPICGKEICSNCYKNVAVYKAPIIHHYENCLMLNTEFEDESELDRIGISVCEDCHKKFNQGQYNRAIKDLIQGFNEKVHDVNRMFHVDCKDRIGN